MQLLKWSTELELGMPNIDSQHKQLINIINELSIAVEYNQPNSALLPVVEKLLAYARTHFRVEEDLFKRHDYVNRIEHEGEHALFVDKVKYIHKICKLIDSPMSSNTKEFLLSWLLNHIKTKDREYKVFIDRCVQKASAEDPVTNETPC